MSFKPLKNNTSITWRTNGRGVLVVRSGTIQAYVPRGALPAQKIRAQLPHGDKLSNRDRYVVITKDGTLVWANAATCVEKGQKLPPHNPRIVVGKSKAKKAVKVKAKKVPKEKKAPKAKNPRVAERKKMSAAAKVKAGDDSYTDKSGIVKKKETPKKTWYALVDGKVVSVRKVICPDGYSAEKPAVKAPEAPAAPAEPAAPAATSFPTA